MFRIWIDLFADDDLLLSGRFYQGYIEAIQSGLSAKDYQSFAATERRLEAAVDGKTSGFLRRFYPVSQGMIPSVDKVFNTVHAYEADREMTITAIALQRYRRARKEFPDSLEDLVPDFLPELPIDWMTGRPLTYEPTSGGWFRLRSAGENGVDDGGSGDDILWLRATNRRRTGAITSDKP